MPELKLHYYPNLTQNSGESEETKRCGPRARHSRTAERSLIGPRGDALEKVTFAGMPSECRALAGLCGDGLVR